MTIVVFGRTISPSRATILDDAYPLAPVGPDVRASLAMRH
jgi:hypothetical protein